MKRTECSISLTVRDETDDSSSIWGSISLKAFRLFFRSVRERICLFLFKRLRIDLLFLDRETLFILFISKKLLSIKLFYYSSLLIILTLFLFLCLQIFITLFEDYENYDEEKINKNFKSRKFLLKKKKRKIGYFNVKDYLSKYLYYIKIFF